jgi:RNase P/RNase MRP subunit p30
MCKEHFIDSAARVDLTPRSPNDLLRSLRRLRRKYELVAVNCVSKAVARQAAKDHRVDLIAFPSNVPRERFFDRAEARVASEGTAALEINMSMLLQTSGYPRARLLSCLRKEAAIAKKAAVPVVMSSHATDKFQLRGPADFASLATLLGMDNVSALEAVSTVPFSIVRRNREKLDSNYVASGIKIIRRSKDCGT